MLLRMLEWTAAAVLALACLPVLAADTECTASVCQDGTWPAIEIAAPSIALDQHFDAEAITEMVVIHITADESVVGHEETAHLHRYALLDDVMHQAEEP